MNDQNRTRSITQMINPTMAAMKQENSRRRKQMKPKFARFKASIKYHNQEFKKPMFSYDWNKQYIENVPRALDSEELGWQTLYLWALKCIQKGQLESITIWMTFRPEKTTDVMDYDTLVCSYHHTQDPVLFLKLIPQIKFIDGKVNLNNPDLVKEKHRQEQERERMKRDRRVA